MPGLPVTNYAEVDRTLGDKILQLVNRLRIFVGVLTSQQVVERDAEGPEVRGVTESLRFTGEQFWREEHVSA